MAEPTNAENEAEFIPPTPEEYVRIRAALAEAGYPDVEVYPEGIFCAPGPKPWAPPAVCWAAVEVSGKRQGCWPCTAEDITSGVRDARTACKHGDCRHPGEERWPPMHLLRARVSA